MQLQPSPRQEAWDEAAGPSVGERINCLDQFLHHNVRAFCFNSIYYSYGVNVEAAGGCIRRDIKKVWKAPRCV